MGLISLISATTIFAHMASSAVIPETGLKARDDSPCSSGPWVGPLAIGANTGTPWCETHWNDGGSHEVISEVEVWATSGNGITGIQFTFAGGHSRMPPKMHGLDNDETDTKLHNKVVLGAGETIKKCSMYSDGTGTRLGRINFETSKGQKLDVGWTNDDTKENDVDVGSGLIGAYGAQGASIDRLAFLFLASPIKKISVTDLEYTNLPHAGDNKDITPLALLDTTIGNSKDSDDDIKVTASVSEKKTNKETWSQSVRITIGMEFAFEMEAKVLGIGGKTTTTAKWEVSGEFSRGGESSDEVTVGTTAERAGVKPGHGARCTITAFKGQGDFDYTSNVNLELEDGSKITYKQNGVLSIETYSEADGQCEDADDPNEWQRDQNSPPEGMTVDK